MQDALVLLAPNIKAKGFVDRLAPLEELGASEVGRAFVKDAIATAQSMKVDTWCSVGSGAEDVARMLPSEIRTFPQPHDDYGSRLHYSSDFLFQHGYKRVIIVPMDCPTVDAKYILLAFDALLGKDAVVGPSTSGGYVLIGLSKPIPRLFIDIDMERDDVLRQTLYRAKELDLLMNVIPPRRGIDSYQDLKEATAAGELQHASNTTAAIASRSV